MDELLELSHQSTLVAIQVRNLHVTWQFPKQHFSSNMNNNHIISKHVAITCLPYCTCDAAGRRPSSDHDIYQTYIPWPTGKWLAEVDGRGTRWSLQVAAIRCIFSKQSQLLYEQKWKVTHNELPRSWTMCLQRLAEKEPFPIDVYGTGSIFGTTAIIIWCPTDKIHL